MDNWKQIVLLAVLAIAVLLIARLGKHRGGNTRSAILMKKYATITEETFAAIQADELVEAVVCRVLSKASAAHTPDPIRTLAELPHGNTVVYSIWAVCKELATSRYAMLVTTATRELVDPAREALSAIGATRCAQALTNLQAAHEAGQPMGVDMAEADFHRAVESECPLSRCEEYIRDHAADFIDA